LQGLFWLVSGFQELSENVQMPQRSLKCNFWRKKGDVRIVWKLLTRKNSTINVKHRPKSLEGLSKDAEVMGAVGSVAVSYSLFNKTNHVKKTRPHYNFTAVSLTKAHRS